MFNTCPRLLAIIGLLIAAGCTGGKMNSPLLGSTYPFQGSPTYDSISVRNLKQVSNSDVFLRELVATLNTSKLYHEVMPISLEDEPKTQLLLEIRLMSNVEQTRLAHAMVGTPDQLGLAGRLIDVKSDTVLVTFELSRSAVGGLLGGGGLFAAGEEAMQKSLADWLSQDIVSILKKRPIIPNMKTSFAPIHVPDISVTVLKSTPPVVQ